MKKLLIFAIYLFLTSCHKSDNEVIPLAGFIYYKDQCAGKLLDLDELNSQFAYMGQGYHFKVAYLYRYDDQTGWTYSDGLPTLRTDAKYVEVIRLVTAYNASREEHDQTEPIILYIKKC